MAAGRKQRDKFGRYKGKGGIKAYKTNLPKGGGKKRPRMSNKKKALIGAAIVGVGVGAYAGNKKLQEHRKMKAAETKVKRWNAAGGINQGKKNPTSNPKPTPKASTNPNAKVGKRVKVVSRVDPLAGKAAQARLNRNPGEYTAAQRARDYAVAARYETELLHGPRISYRPLR